MGHTLIALMLNTFQKKSGEFLTINVITNIFGKHASDLILCSEVKSWQILPIYSHRTILRKLITRFLIIFWDFSSIEWRSTIQTHSNKKVEDFFIAEINGRKKISKTINKYITVVNYVDKNLLVLSGASCGVSLWKISTIIVTPLGIAIASISQMFLITQENCQNVFKNNEKEKIKHRKIALLAGASWIT